MSLQETLVDDQPADRILFVDDEAYILFSLRRFFKQHNIEVDVETDCFKAVELVRDNKYKVIISDFRMPAMNGVEFLDVVKEISPDSIRLMLSAQVSQEALFDIINKIEVYRFISKPWKDADLLNVIKDSISKYNKKSDSIQSDFIVAPNPVLLKQVEALSMVQIDNDHVEEDLYLNNILPQSDYGDIDTKKLCEILRTEQHQHLSYIINLTSSKIGNHCKRVSQLSAYIGNAMKLPIESQRNLYFAALYHDIGKVFELVTQTEHCEIGANLLSSFIELKEVSKIVRYHHTRLDTQGGTGIPIESKILAIVDSFDKLVNMEVNKELDEKPKTLPDILNIMELEKGSRFDVDILDVFKEVIQKDFKLDAFFNERKIHIVELEEGMVLSRPLFNVEGKMLLNSEYKITKLVLKRLHNHNDLVGIKNPFYVYQVSPEKTFNFEELISKKIVNFK